MTQFQYKAIDKHGYNSAVLGADAYASAQYKKNFSEAYPGNALANLNPWPSEPQWYADVRTEYRNKFVNAIQGGLFVQGHIVFVTFQGDGT